jgi:hypothetical protein
MESICPDTAVWQTFLDGSITPDDRAVAESHLVRCRLCREGLIALSDASSENAVSDEAPISVRNRAVQLASRTSDSTSFVDFLRPYIPLALAATIVLAVGLSVLIYRNKTEPQRTAELRQSDRATAQLSLNSPANGAVLDSGKLEFSWADAGTGVRYEFTITDEKGDIVVRENPANNSVSLDSRALRLSPQRRYYWTVSARLPDGTRRESSVAGFSLK